MKKLLVLILIGFISQINSLGMLQKFNVESKYGTQQFFEKLSGKNIILDCASTGPNEGQSILGRDYVGDVDNTMYKKDKPILGQASKCKIYIELEGPLEGAAAAAIRR